MLGTYKLKNLKHAAKVKKSSVPSNLKFPVSPTLNQRLKLIIVSLQVKGSSGVILCKLTLNPKRGRIIFQRNG